MGCGGSCRLPRSSSSSSICIDEVICVCDGYGGGGELSSRVRLKTERIPPYAVSLPSPNVQQPSQSSHKAFHWLLSLLLLVSHSSSGIMLTRSIICALSLATSTAFIVPNTSTFIKRPSTHLLSKGDDVTQQHAFASGSFVEFEEKGRTHIGTIESVAHKSNGGTRYR
jgi:hypothetical protein